MSEYLLRVKPRPSGGYEATIRRIAGTAHPEVRAVIGTVSRGEGATEPAAMLAAICSARIGETSQRVREVPRNGC